MLNYTKAYAAGVAAADERMKREGRTRWNEQDWDVAVKVMTEELQKKATAA